MKSGSLNLLEPSGPHRACYGTPLPLHVSGDYVPIIRRKQLYLCDTWYLLFCTDDCLVCRVELFSPDDGQTVARNMQRKEINILRRIVHQVGFIYKIIKSFITATCFGSSYRAVFRLGLKKCFIQLAMFYRVRDSFYILLIYIMGYATTNSSYQ